MSPPSNLRKCAICKLHSWGDGRFRVYLNVYRYFAGAALSPWVATATIPQRRQTQTWTIPPKSMVVEGRDLIRSTWQHRLHGGASVLVVIHSSATAGGDGACTRLCAQLNLVSAEPFLDHCNELRADRGLEMFAVAASQPHGLGREESLGCTDGRLLRRPNPSAEWLLSRTRNGQLQPVGQRLAVPGADHPWFAPSLVTGRTTTTSPPESGFTVISQITALLLPSSSTQFTSPFSRHTAE